MLQSADGWGPLAGLSFAVACLSLSFLIPFRARDRKAGEGDLRAEYRPASRMKVEQHARAECDAEIVNAFTIDLEDYFHTEVSSRHVGFEQWSMMPLRIESSLHQMLDLLDEQEVRATIFVLGWIAEKHPRVVREVARRGHEIACHSYRHRRVNQLSPRAFREDTQIAKRAIENATGRRVEGYRAPSFSITPGTEWAFDVLEELGFTYDSSVHPVRHASYSNSHAPRFPYFAAGSRVLEIPIATWRWLGMNLPVGGGAYLRLLPYPYISRGLADVNRREGQPVTVYVHPWEIDYLQPAIQGNWPARVRQLWGTRTMEEKLRELLSAMRFASISEVYGPSMRRSSPPSKAAGDEVPYFAQVS